MNTKDKRQLNERKFTHWEQLPNGGRRYWLEVKGRYGKKARYIKEVDAMEEIVKFYQEVYNSRDMLMEIHEKTPVDKGHVNVGE